VGSEVGVHFRRWPKEKYNMQKTPPLSVHPSFNSNHQDDSLAFDMAPEQKKRARPVPNASQRSKKRQKIDSAKDALQAVQKRPVALDALPWNEVEMPEMFDDAEGFFGLEEVDGVEVVREGDTVKFVCPIALSLWREYLLHADVYRRTVGRS
jgi:hypothetical protein